MPVSLLLAVALHVGLLLWWFVHEPLALQQHASAPEETVNMVLLPATELSPPPMPVESLPQPVLEPAPLRRDDMAQTHRVVKPQVKAVKKPVQQATVTPASERSAGEPSAAPVVVPVQPARHDADYLNNPPPVYPALSRRLGEEGQVVLRVHVSTDGSVQRVELTHSSGFLRLDEAAKKAAEKWRFVPARQGEVALASRVEVPVHFSLKQ